MRAVRVFVTLCVVLLSWPLVLGQTLPNTGIPYVVPHTASTSMSNIRSWPACSWNLHGLANHGQSNLWLAMGGQFASYNTPGYASQSNGGFNCCNGFAGTEDISVSPSMTLQNIRSGVYPSQNWSAPGWSSTQVFQCAYWSGGNWPCSAISRVAPGSVVLKNGNVLVMGGKSAPNWVYTNDVVYSMDNANSWQLATATAPWVARSDFSVAVAPGTNVVVLTGGEYSTSNNPPYLNDVWVSSDGIGAVWTQQTASAGFQIFQQGPMTFMWDGQATGGSNQYATLVLYNPDDNNVYTSTNYGSSWMKMSNLASFGNINPQQTGRMTADLEGNLFMAGGAEVGGQVYYSANKGVTWGQLTASTFYPGLLIDDPVSLTNFQYGCLGVNYVQSTTAPSGWHRQLVLWAGWLTAQQDVNSQFGCLLSSNVAAFTSVIAEVVFPGESTGSWGEYNPPPGNNSVASATVVFHDAANQLIYRAYSDWTYDVHASINRNSSVRMWQFGGFTSPQNVPSWQYIPSTDFTATGSWNNFVTFSPGYNMGNSGYPPPSGKVAAGVGLLANNNLLLFGGKDSNSTQWTNDVYFSSNNGYNYTLATWSAPWSQRSDMSVAVMPGLNVVVLGGGQGPPYGWNVQDWWFSTDGQGAVWQAGAQTTAFGIFQNAALVAMYDNSAVIGGSKTYSTLIINPGSISSSNGDGLYSSTNAGASWTFIGTAPWSQRLRNIFVADMEGDLFMLGGWPGNSGDIWVSTNVAQSWTLMAQSASSPVWSNTFAFQSAQQFDAGLRYAVNPNSPNSYHKQLVLWGGPGDPANGLPSIMLTQQPSPSCVRSVPVTVAYADIMFPSELALGSGWIDTLATARAPNANAPTVAWNSPTSLLTYRQYSSCASDVHAPINGNTLNSYALGGWDANGQALTTLDLISASNINSYSYVVPQWGNGLQPVSGRVAGISAVTNRGSAIVWGAGKLGIDGSYSNDVWYSTNQGRNFSLATANPGFNLRSDMATVALPGTWCIVMTGGQGVYNNVGNFLSGQVWFNDVWSSCDGYGMQWTQQTAAAPFAQEQQASIVALYDNTASSNQNPTNTIVYYNWGDQFIRTSNNLGAGWTIAAQAPWNQRTARFVADTSNNIYMPGGMNPNNNAGDTGNWDQAIGDTWYSTNKGATWTQLTASTSAGYNTPVLLSTAAYSCATLVPGTSPHRQIMLYSNWIEAFNPNTGVVATGFNPFPTVQCICDSLSGIRGVIGDLIFPGETPNNLPGSSSGGGSKSFSAGQTAGIAIGVGVGCMLICCLLGLLFFTLGMGTGKTMKTPAPGPQHTKMENEPSQSEATTGGRNVELTAAP